MLAGAIALLLLGFQVPPLPPAEPPAPPVQAAAAGEDLGASGSGELVVIGQQMAAAEQLLRRTNTSQETQHVQSRIIQELDRLIDRQAPQESPSSASRTNGREPAANGGTDQAGTTAGGAAGDGGTTPQVSRSEVWQRIWGELPNRVRQQIDTPLHESFLPKYDELIQEYYKRLAEEGERR